MTDSHIKGVSIRAIVTFIVTATYCAVCAWVAYREGKAPDHLVNVVLLVLGFYFGQKKPSA